MMNQPCHFAIFSLLFLLLVPAHSRGQDSTIIHPDVHHPNIAEVTLFAAEPEIVTPIGVAVAPDGRVFVQENHTHKRPATYEGPETDRILVFEDTDDDGVADRRSVFYEGHVHSTDLIFGPDGHLYVSTRWFVGRFRDAAGKTEAGGDPEVLVECRTDGDYPHNGVGGLAIDPANPDWLAFGFGENLGADYTFVGSDGTELSGGGEGGTTYRCRTDGSELERLSTGHWNAFGMTYDLSGHLFSTDNDPNSTPPNRLLHVVPGADFGYEYRYGRSGRHPLVTWYGEIPGTLAMAGPLGEAASGVIPFGPGHLLTASWTDNRVDLHQLSPKGASFAADRVPLLSGPGDFRPVHFAWSGDGRHLYVTDWVKLSYPVHGHGRIWRVSFNDRIQQAPEPRTPEADVTAGEALALLGDEDPYVRTRAMTVLTRSPEVLRSHDWQAMENAVARAHFAVTLKRSGAVEAAKVIPDLLADPDEDVRYVGIKWIADERLAEFRELLLRQKERTDLSRRSLLAVVAALDRVGGSGAGEFSPGDALLEIAADSAKAPAIRALALNGVPADHEALTVDLLASLLASDSDDLKREAVQSLVLHPDPERETVLARVAADDDFPEERRADAIAGLAPFAEAQRGLLEKLAEGNGPVVAVEARRTLAVAGIAPRSLPAKPPVTDIDAWVELVRAAPGEANPETGRRLFFHSRVATCYRCHKMDGRGVEVGPDLTTLRQQSEIDPAWLLEHILDPNAEVAPYFRPLAITTRDGKSHMGFILGAEGKVQGYVGADGNVFHLAKADIVERQELPISLMPPGLLFPLTASEIRDLLVYLIGSEEVKERSFFNVGQSGGRSHLVSPAGEPFLVLGINHLKDIDRRADEERWNQIWSGTLRDQFRDWNVNSLGYGAPEALRSKMPWVVAMSLVPIEKHRSDPRPGVVNSYHFPDVFDPEWAEQIGRRIRAFAAPLRDDPNLIGYFWTDTPTWDLLKTRALRGTEWVSQIRALPGGAPGRLAYARFLESRYRDRIGDLNQFYGLDLEDWSDLASTDLTRIAIGRHVVRADDEAFLGEIARRFYEIVGRAQREADPNHLVFGDRFLVGDTPSAVVEAALPWIDAIAVQPGDRYSPLYPPGTIYPEREMERLHQLTGKPLLICDHAISFPTAKHPRVIFEPKPDEGAAAAATAEFLEKAFAAPYVIGYLRCQYNDRPASYGRGLRQGLIDAEGLPRERIVEAYRNGFASSLERLKLKTND